jgi:hypothetical protein
MGMNQLQPHLRTHRRIVILGGMRYREFLVEPLERAGVTVDEPLEHLRRGEQLAWLSEHE